MSERKQRVPGRFVRTLKAAWLGGRVGGSYLGAKLAGALRAERSEDAADRHAQDAERHAQNARRIARTMAEVRGPLMKIGQVLATHAEALPEEYGDILRSLAASAPPMSFASIREVVEADLGEPIERAFDEFSREAVAAASLGQVHRARLHSSAIGGGADVAVKVQYPGADEAVKSDLSNLEAGTAMVRRLMVDMLGKSRFDLTPLAEEIAEHLLQETDYCREAYNCKLLGALFASDPQIVVPRVHDAQSGLRVITFDWLDGQPIDEALKHGSPAARERIVRQLVHAFWHQFFRGGLLHADPQPGNFTILDDGRLGILDYGCVKIFDEAFMNAFGRMILARFADDRARMRESFVELGMMSDPEDDEQFEDIEKLTRYFSVGVADDHVFDYRELDYVASARELVMHFVRRGHPPPAHKQVVFLMRVLLGFYEYFARAGVPLNFHRLVLPYVERGFEGRAVDIPPYDA